MGPRNRYHNFDPGAILLNPHVRRMGAEAFGGFMALVMEAMVSEEGWLPDDEAELAFLSRLGKDVGKYLPIYRKLMTSDAERDLVTFEIVLDSIARANKKSQQGTDAVNKRWAESRLLESTSDTDVEHSVLDEEYERIIAGITQPILRKEKKREEKKSKEKQSTSLVGSPGATPTVASEEPRMATPLRDIYTEGYEGFWSLWRKLGATTTLNKKAAYDAFKKAVSRGASAESLIESVRLYDKYLEFKCKNGKPDARDFVPMPETWLNQGRYASEYPAELFDAMIGEPVPGVDYQWVNYKQGTYDYVGKFKVIDGKVTDEHFSEKAWREAKRKEQQP